MATTFDAAPARRADRQVVVGRVLSGLVILFLAADALGKLVAPATMIAHSPPLGFPADPGLYRLLGAILAACTALYAVPRTAFVGAVLLTGYLGGAIAVNVRAEMPLISNTLFGVYLGLFVWAGLYLRSARLRAVIHGA
ncbi:MAG: DoxX family protein [Sphingomonas sp.]